MSISEQKPAVGQFVLRMCVACICFVAMWHLLALLPYARSLVPTPGAVVLSLWNHRSDLLFHLLPTIYRASAGYLIGAVVGICASLASNRWSLIERFMTGALVGLYAFPLLILVLIIDQTVSSRNAGIVAVSAIASFYPIYSNFSLGLRSLDVTVAEVGRSMGANRSQLFRYFQFPTSIPYLVTGLQTAVPFCVLGELLGEFAGVQSGLGKYLVGVITQARPDRLWATAAVISSLGLIPYLALGRINSRIMNRTSFAGVGQPLVAPTAKQNRVLWFFCMYAALLGWWLIHSTMSGDKLIAKGPFDIYDYYFVSGHSEHRLSELLHALIYSCATGGLGMLVAVSFAVTSALAFTIYTSASRFFLPFAMVSQVVPLVAWIPILRSILGDGVAVTIAVVISATFLPAFDIVSNGLRAGSPAWYDVVRLHTNNPWKELYFVSVPASMRHIATAVKYCVVRAMLGVILAEYLITGRGLGGLAYKARGAVDFNSLWTIGIIAGLVSLFLYQIAELGESYYESRGAVRLNRANP